MRRARALVHAGLLAGTLTMAARASAQAASSFERVPLPTPAPAPHRAAWLLGGAGVALVGASFLWANTADDRYAAYLSETDAARIDGRWNATVRADRLASGSLIVGEAALAAAVYLRFIRRPDARHVTFLVEPDRCAVTWRF
jgi:hypothetical protein